MNSLHIMLDLETLSTAPDAAIVSIGACVIGTQSENPGFYQAVDIVHTKTDKLGAIDKNTVQWWMRQPPEAQAVFTDPNAKKLGNALMDFCSWMSAMRQQHSVHSSRNTHLWGNSAAFDCVILRNAVERESSGLAIPAHWNDRCYRTVSALAPSIKREQFGTHHNALDDAKSQAQHLVKVLKHLGKTTEDVA